MIFQITQDMVDRSSTMEQSDVGRWAYMISGCYQFFDTEEEARESYKEVFK